VNTSDLIATLRSVARSDLQIRNQAAEVICELSRHDLTSRSRRIEVSIENFRVWKYSLRDFGE
jgi:hypothetical protein